MGSSNTSYFVCTGTSFARPTNACTITVRITNVHSSMTITDGNFIVDSIGSVFVRSQIETY